MESNPGYATTEQMPGYVTTQQAATTENVNVWPGVSTTESDVPNVDPDYTVTTTENVDNRPERPSTEDIWGPATSQNPNEDTQAPAVSTTEISSEAPSGTTQVPGGDFTGDATTEQNQVIIQEEMPTGYFMASGDAEGTLYYVTTDSVYSVDGGVTWNAITSEGTMDISGVTVQYGIMLKRLGDGVTTADSAITKIMISQASTPKFKATQPTADDAMGYIPLTPSHEYRALGDTAWLSATGTTAVEPGTYEVRVRANGVTLASKTQTIVITVYDAEATTSVVASTEQTTSDNQTNEGLPDDDGKVEVPDATTEADKPELPTTENVEDATTEADRPQLPTTEDTSTSYAVISENGTSQVVLVANPSAKKEYTNSSGETALTITKKNKVTITKSGTYRFTQTSSEALTGRIEIDEGCEDVTIILAGVNLTSDDTDGVLTVKKKACNVNVILEDGTENVFTDTAAIETEEVTEEVTDETTGETTEVTTTETVYPDGAVVCKQHDLVISGSGSLTVSSNLGTGVKSTGSLTINDDAKVTVTSAGSNGVSGKIALTIENAEVNVTCDGDGIKTTTPDDETDESLGNIVLNNAKITIVSNEDGVQAYRNATITDCTMDVTATKDDSKLTTVEGETKDSFKGIKAAVLTFNGGNYTVVCNYDKCIKADTELNINGGTFDVTSGDKSSSGSNNNNSGFMPGGNSSNTATGDDGLHSDGSVTIDGDSTDITIWAADDGIHANDTLTIKNGKINITNSYEGLEAANVIISGGETSVVASDDGVNVAGGDGSGDAGGDQFGPGMGWGGSTGTTTSGNYYLEITGGKLYVNSVGDGLDSNGSITMSGGEVYVSGPTNGGNGVLDYDQSFTISGGTLVATEAQGAMQQTPSASGDACVVRFSSLGTQAAGTTISLKDSDGNEIVSYAPEKSFGSVVISSTELNVGSTYTLYLNGQQASTVTLSSNVTGGSSSGGGNQGGWW